MPILIKPDALFSIPDENGDLLIQINRDFSIEISEKTPRDSLFAKFWTELSEWRSLASDESIKNKCLLAMCFTCIREVNEKKALKMDKLADGGNLWLRVSDELQRKFY